MSSPPERVRGRSRIIHAFACLGVGIMSVFGFAGAGLLVMLFPVTRPGAPVSRFFDWGMDWGGEYFVTGFATACFLYFIWALTYLLNRPRQKERPKDADAD